MTPEQRADNVYQRVEHGLNGRHEEKTADKTRTADQLADMFLSSQCGCNYGVVVAMEDIDGLKRYPQGHWVEVTARKGDRVFYANHDPSPCEIQANIIQYLRNIHEPVSMAVVREIEQLARRLCLLREDR